MERQSSVTAERRSSESFSPSLPSNGVSSTWQSSQVSDRPRALEAKVVILGAQGVGKTSLVLRNLGGSFSDTVLPTIGASFFSFNISLSGLRVKLQVWDTAGQERFRSMAPMYYRRANAAVIVYDIANQKSFQEAKSWMEEVQSKTDSPLALSIVGNKSDMEEQRQISRCLGEDFAHAHGAMFTETSAKDNTGIKEAFMKVAQGVIEMHQSRLLASTSIESSYGLNSPIDRPRSSFTPNGQSNTYQQVYLYNTDSIDPNGKNSNGHSKSKFEKKQSCCS